MDYLLKWCHNADIFSPPSSLSLVVWLSNIPFPFSANFRSLALDEQSNRCCRNCIRDLCLGTKESGLAQHCSRVLVYWTWKEVIEESPLHRQSCGPAAINRSLNQTINTIFPWEVFPFSIGYWSIWTVPWFHLFGFGPALHWKAWLCQRATTVTHPSTLSFFTPCLKLFWVM